MQDCKNNDLHVTSFTWDGNEIDPRGESCFVIHDVVGTPKGGLIRARVGLGTFRVNGKARIEWKTMVGNPDTGNYSEIVPTETAAAYGEIAIERKQNVEEAI